MRKHEFAPENAPVSMLMQRICHVHDFAVRSKLEKIGVTRAFGPVLRMLHQRDGLTQSELAHVLNFRSSSVSVTLQQMTELGYIEKKQSGNDARNVYIYLTDRGRALEAQIKQTFDELDTELVSALVPSEQEELKRLLIKMHNYQLSGSKDEQKD